MSEQDAFVKIAELEAEIEQLGHERDQCEAEAKGLIEGEAVGGPSHAAEIHRLKQRKMMLGTQMQHLRARASALKLGIY
ncbi:MAG: hypothetical protein K9K66_18095 [Desulfarculaceae bacterium]|nr:hypothetical protein [Desulfarculaceae bacterium]MCF8074515.1 hypothetical protein [Desulfarculaceae bacterium]MCF8103573.1 hypothetical protein [Desulfarculaceae bacterium]MCF8118237.1 hypothetical protein [Desulfarculaceae bacterium]